MNKRKSTLNISTVKKKKVNKNSGSVKRARARSETWMRITRGLETKVADKETKRERLEKMCAANGCHQKVIKYPQVLDSILVINTHTHTHTQI